MIIWVTHLNYPLSGSAYAPSSSDVEFIFGYPQDIWVRLD